jgi:hypothetical protein
MSKIIRIGGATASNEGEHVYVVIGSGEPRVTVLNPGVDKKSNANINDPAKDNAASVNLAAVQHQKEAQQHVLESQQRAMDAQKRAMDAHKQAMERHAQLMKEHQERVKAQQQRVEAQMRKMKDHQLGIGEQETHGLDADVAAAFATGTVSFGSAIASGPGSVASVTNCSGYFHGANAIASGAGARASVVFLSHSVTEEGPDAPESMVEAQAPAQNAPLPLAKGISHEVSNVVEKPLPLNNAHVAPDQEEPDMR